MHSDNPRRLGGAGTYPEYLGNRPYVPGDPPSRIDARAWARLSVPAVREFQETGDLRLGLFLDTCPAQTSSSPHAFEAAVSLCASLAHSVRRYGTIEWFATGADVHGLTAVPSGDRFDRIHEVLADVEPTEQPAVQTPSAAMPDLFATVSAVLFVVLSWDTVRRECVAWARQAGCRVLTLVVAPEVDTPGRQEGPDLHWVSPSQAMEGRVRL